MRMITWAILGWTVLWIVAVWALDPASTVGGKPPAWVLFELWAVGFVLLGALSAGLLTVRARGRVGIDPWPLRSVRGAVLAWTVLWMVLFAIWSLNPDPSSAGWGPGSAGPLRLKPPEWMLFGLWTAGLALVGAAWLVARAWGAWRRRS